MKTIEAKVVQEAICLSFHQKNHQRSLLSTKNTDVEFASKWETAGIISKETKTCESYVPSKKRYWIITKQFFATFSLTVKLITIAYVKKVFEVKKVYDNYRFLGQLFLRI